jgi:hypothetical protein
MIEEAEKENSLILRILIECVLIVREWPAQLFKVRTSLLNEIII